MSSAFFSHLHQCERKAVPLKIQGVLSQLRETLTAVCIPASPDEARNGTKGLNATKSQRWDFTRAFHVFQEWPA